MEEELVKDFTTSMETSGSGSVAGGDGVLGEAKLSASVDTVDGLALPVSMMKKKADIKKIRNTFSGRYRTSLSPSKCLSRNKTDK